MIKTPFLRLKGYYLKRLYIIPAEKFSAMKSSCSDKNLKSPPQYQISQVSEVDLLEKITYLLFPQF